MFKAALAFAGAVMGKGAPDTSPSTISNEGAKINHGRSLDQRGVPAAQNAGGSGVNVGTGAAGPGGGGASAGNSGSANGSSNEGVGEGRMESQAFRRALWGQPGESQTDTMRDLLQTADGEDLVIGGPTGAGTVIPAGGLKININTSSDEFDLGWIRMTKHHIFVEVSLHVEPTTPDADKPSGFGLTPLTGQGGASDRPPQPGQSGSFPNAKMRWYNLGPGTLRWRLWRGLSPTDPQGRPFPVRSSLVGTVTFTESDTWPNT